MVQKIFFENNLVAFVHSKRIYLTEFNIKKMITVFEALYISLTLGRFAMARFKAGYGRNDPKKRFLCVRQ